jgi:hypothetical protein
MNALIPIKRKNNRACGSRFELECKNDALAKGLRTNKSFLSGQLDGSGDIQIVSSWDEMWDGECKWRKLMPAWFVKCLGSRRFAVFKESRGEKLVVLRWDDFLELLQ